MDFLRGGASPVRGNIPITASVVGPAPVASGGMAPGAGLETEPNKGWAKWFKR